MKKLYTDLKNIIEFIRSFTSLALYGLVNSVHEDTKRVKLMEEVTIGDHK